MLLRGCFRLLFLYDVGEAIDLKRLRELLGPRGGPIRGVFPRRTPEYVRFEEAPIIEPGESVSLGGGQRVACSLKYYAFAVVVVQFDIPFEGDWNNVLAQASRWMDASEIDTPAREIARRHVEQVAPAIIRPTKQDWLVESYFITNLEQIREAGGEPAKAGDLMTSHASEIVQLVRGDFTPVPAKAAAEALETSVSYYPTDLVVAGSTAAVIYDRAEDAAATFQVLEYAKMQLLEFRYYDGLMTRLLSDVYDVLETKRNLLFQRWSLPREAERFNTIRLDVMELTERIDNAIKFVSDVYYARVYRMAAARLGVSEYRNLVEEKLRTDGRTLRFHGGPVQRIAVFFAGIGGGGDGAAGRDPVRDPISEGRLAKGRFRPPGEGRRSHSISREHRFFYSAGSAGIVRGRAAGRADRAGRRGGYRADAGDRVSREYELRHRRLAHLRDRDVFGRGGGLRAGGLFEYSHRNVSGDRHDDGCAVWRLSGDTIGHRHYRDCLWQRADRFRAGFRYAGWTLRPRTAPPIAWRPA